MLYYIIGSDLSESIKLTGQSLINAGMALTNAAIELEKVETKSEWNSSEIAKQKELLLNVANLIMSNIEQ